MKYLPILFFALITNYIYSQEEYPTIGSKWTFEIVDGSIGGGHAYIKYGTKQILDTVNTNGKRVYYWGYLDSMYLENGKMFFWDNGLKSYEMNYDFNSTTNYEIKYFDISRRNVQIAKVKVDSIYNTILFLDTIQTQLLRISNNGSYPDDAAFIVYKNIGASKYDVRLHLGYGLQDNQFNDKLRCFKSNSISYNFQYYPCDSIWFSRGSINTFGTEQNQLTINPNPTSDLIHISGTEKDLAFILYDLQGKKISSGMTINREINIPFTGVFIVKFHLDNGYVMKKVVRI
ncbi:MAG: T9SS type A sorting domain-containing protein [Saprospiraceae bacterium]|uniref:T9SS type A sorting domain-containing protein n=1 Tax=Candidatus Defluviibacterium haderslevense TaxID=2981993 RepID=A0A9D7XD79_9BACT|nr:T9SS type A sorting domain-containing protein [Candidatus Defluviibacterium haderslevense]MBL0238692.1 T9SS type A sorting domain-containing protein [Candidatus Defluviibacterium haderslevense]